MLLSTGRLISHHHGRPGRLRGPSTSYHCDTVVDSQLPPPRIPHLVSKPMSGRVLALKEAIHYFSFFSGARCANIFSEDSKLGTDGESECRFRNYCEA